MQNRARTEMSMEPMTPSESPPTPFRLLPYLRLMSRYGVRGAQIWIPCRQRRNRLLQAEGRLWTEKEVAVVGKTIVSRRTAMSSFLHYNESWKRYVLPLTRAMRWGCIGHGLTPDQRILPYQRTRSAITPPHPLNEPKTPPLLASSCHALHSAF